MAAVLSASEIRAHVSRRARVIALGMTVGAAATVRLAAPPPRTLDGLATLLGRAVSGDVRPSDIVWEPTRGVVAEALFGRRLLFLATSDHGAMHDVFRARVRLTAEGQPIDATDVRNLTRTPLGDEAGLEIRGDTAIFATTAYGQVQGVTVLDVDGVASTSRPSSPFGRLLLALSSEKQTGSFSGIDRTDLVFDPPARSAKLSLAPPRITVDISAPNETVTYDLAERRLSNPTDGTAAVRVVRHDYSGRGTLAWSVDVLRSYVGPFVVARAEDAFFGVTDVAKRSFSRLFSWSATSRLKPGAPVERAHPLTPTEIARDRGGWPPPAIPSLWEERKEGEGVWVPVELPWLPVLASDAGKSDEPYFYRTFIRPDPQRPYSEVLLIAMDTRQLEIRMEGGYEEPRPLVGPPGTGRIPADPKVLPRTVAAWNGAFKTDHGAYGMMVDRRVLLPPVPGAATVLVTRDGALGLGSWPKENGIPEDILSFRQNLDPLVAEGIPNPAGRHVWGFQIEGESSQTERSAMCLTDARHIYYAWGRDIGGPMLAEALKEAGCSYAIHLDMNPRHCGFVFMHTTDVLSKDAHYLLADSTMNVNPSRYVLGSDKDFFYAMLRDAGLSDGGGAKWSPSPGAQPPPAFFPGIYEAERVVGDLRVRLVAFDSDRVDWVARAGTEEPSVAGARPKKVGLEPAFEGRAITAIGLGHTTNALRYGLAFDGQPSLDLRQSYATLVVARSGKIRILAPGDRTALAAGEDAVQLPLLASDGEVDTRGSDRGTQRLRGALCVLPTGRLLVALGAHDSNDPLASALLESGCTRVVSLDRGSRHAAFVHRAGTSDPPLNRYETTTLYALSRPMTPRAFFWNPSEPR
jgi:hypothetical protein